VNIAFASSDGELIDQHFGWSKKFYLYRVNKESSEFIEEIESSNEPEGEKEKLDYKIGTISRAEILYCTQIGPNASKMVQSAGIYPARVAEGESITEAIKKLQATLNDNPPPWLLRIYYKTEERDK
jgi:nitrogen fixation protein NifX